jgi:hypothetical protein
MFNVIERRADYCGITSGHVTVEGVKSDLHVQCIGAVPAVKNDCPEQPWYHQCAVNDTENPYGFSGA